MEAPEDHMQESLAAQRLKERVAKALGYTFNQVEDMSQREFENLVSKFGLGPPQEADPSFAGTSLASPLMHLDFPNMRETYPGTLDIYFLFRDEETGEESKLAAHKLLLAMSSEVFMNQFFTQFAEATQGTVNITDSSFHSFKIFLDHIYGIKIPWSDLSHSTLYQLFHLANKYQIGSLAQHVCKCVSDMQVTCENILEVASIGLSVMSIDAEPFCNSLCASVQKISVDTFSAIFCTEFDMEEMKLLHKFFGIVENGRLFTYVQQELNLKNISNLLRNQITEFSVVSTFIETNLPMLVTELFSKIPSGDKNSSQLFRLIKLGFKSFEVHLEQLDGRQVNLELCPLDTIYTVKEKVKKAQPGHMSCKRWDVEVVSVVENKVPVFCKMEPSCQIIMKTETKLEKEYNVVADFDIKPISHKLIQKSAIISVIQRSQYKEDVGRWMLDIGEIKVFSDDTIKDIKVKVKENLGTAKRSKCRLTTWTKSEKNCKILQDKVTVKELVLKEKYWGKLLLCDCSRPHGGGCIHDLENSYDSDVSDEDEDLGCDCTCHS